MNSHELGKKLLSMPDKRVNFIDGSCDYDSLMEVFEVEVCQNGTILLSGSEIPERVYAPDTSPAIDRWHRIEVFTEMIGS